MATWQSRRCLHPCRRMSLSDGVGFQACCTAYARLIGAGSSLMPQHAGLMQAALVQGQAAHHRLFDMQAPQLLDFKPSCSETGASFHQHPSITQQGCQRLFTFKTRVAICLLDDRPIHCLRVTIRVYFEDNHYCLQVSGARAMPCVLHSACSLPCYVSPHFVHLRDD